jgi:hypothetical protein
MATQARVSRWTHQTSKSKLANPFLPTEVDPAERSDFYSTSKQRQSPSSSSSSSLSSSSGTAKPPLKRSHTAPDSRSHHNHTHGHRSPSHPHTSTSHSSSTTIKPPSGNGTYSDYKASSSASSATLRPHTSRSRTVVASTSGTKPARSSPLRSNTMPTSYYTSGGVRHTVLPAASKPGNTYIIIPQGQNVSIIVSIFPLFLSSIRPVV